MKSKKKIIQPLQTCIYIILILLAVVYIAPMLWVLLVSLKTNAECHQTLIASKIHFNLKKKNCPEKQFFFFAFCL